MKILITGVCGFLGSYLAKELIGNGCSVIGVDITPDTNRVRSIINNVKFRLLTKDVTNEDDCKSIFYKNPDIDIVIHLAEMGITSDITSANNLMQRCFQKPNMRFVYISNDKNSLDEAFTYKQYIQLAVESTIRGFCQLYGLESYIFKVPEVLGRYETDSTVEYIIRTLKVSDKVAVYDELFSFAYIKEVIQSIIENVGKGFNNSLNIFHWNTSKVSMEQVTDRIGKAMSVTPNKQIIKSNANVHVVTIEPKVSTEGAIEKAIVEV